MAESVKVKYEYQSPENVEAEVPGSQNIREAQTENETGEIILNYVENAGETSRNNDETSKDNSQKREHVFKEEHSAVRQEDVETRHRHVFSGKRNGIHGEPVMLGNRLEDKKIKTKIPVSRFRQTVERVKAERKESKEKKERESLISIRRSSIPKPVREHQTPATLKKDITTTKTLIKNDTVESVTKTNLNKETTDSLVKSKKEMSTIEAEDEFDKLYAEVVNETPTEVVLDDSLLNSVEDPGKLEIKFEEIIHDYDDHKLEPIDVEVVRRSKLPLLKRKSQQEIELTAQAERTSRIIAARDKLRLRHSMNTDEKFEKALDEELKKAQNSNVTNDNENKDEYSVQKEAPNVDTKAETEIKHEIISSPNSRRETVKHIAKTVSTSSADKIENMESSSVVESMIVKEITNREIKDTKEGKNNIIEENVMKSSIIIGIPHFDSHIQELIKSNELEQPYEVKKVLSNTFNGETLSVSNSTSETESISETKTERNISEIKKETSSFKLINDIETKAEFSDISINNKISETENYEDVSTKSKNLENIQSSNITSETSLTNSMTAIDDAPKPSEVKRTEINEVQLRGKMEIVNKKDSKEIIETEKNKRESINELTTKKSVLSKIAMFEKNPDEPSLLRSPKKETKLPKLVTKNWQRVEHQHVHTPLIVDEVFKPFKSDLPLNYTENKGEIPFNRDNDIISIVRAESVTLESSDTVHYATENNVQVENKTETKTVEVIPQPTLLAKIDSNYMQPKVDTSTTINLNSDVTDVPTPIINSNKFEFKSAADKVKNLTKLSLTKELQPPVVIPGFKPVRTLLKSFESINDINRNQITRSVSKEQSASTSIKKFSVSNIANKRKVIKTQISQTDLNKNEEFASISDYKSLDDVFTKETDNQKLKLRKEDDIRRAKSLAELDLGDAVKGKVGNMILRMKSVDRIVLDRKETINKKEMPRKRSVLEKIALFEGKLTPSKGDTPPLSVYNTERTTERAEQKTPFQPATASRRCTFVPVTEKIDISKTNSTSLTENFTLEDRTEAQEDIIGEVEEEITTEDPINEQSDEEKIQKAIEDLENAKNEFGRVECMESITISEDIRMPFLAVGTALLDPRLAYHIVKTAIELGYRSIDTAYIYGTEEPVGRAIRDKIADGTVKREDLFIMSKLWSTYHRTDLVEVACRASLTAMGLEYFDLYMIHNPMSFMEDGDVIPKIANVVQYSKHDYLDAWHGMETLVTKGLVRTIGVSNFNSTQLHHIIEKGRVKPVVNQVECHPYLSQRRLAKYCADRNITLSCFGVLGSKGTPAELKNGQPAVIDDPFVKVMASGLGITPAELLIGYQLENGRGVVVKASSAHHLVNNLKALRVDLTTAQIGALDALNSNKRMFTFKGMGDTHKNYPFNGTF